MQAPVKRGDVDHGRRLVAAAVGDGIAQHQSALGVGVENLDRLSRHGRDDIGGFDGGAARHVFRRRDDRDHIDRQLQFGDRAQSAEDGAPPLMSNFISSMAGGSFSEIPPESKVMPLPIKQMGAMFLRVPLIFADDETRRLRGALGHGQERAHFQRFDCRLVQYLGLDAGEFLGQLRRRVSP